MPVAECLLTPIVPSITITWGIVMTLMGIVTNYQGLLAARFFLGVPESGIFPACAYYVTSWYSRHEAMYRTALFYATASLAYVQILLVFVHLYRFVMY